MQRSVQLETERVALKHLLEKVEEFLVICEDVTEEDEKTEEKDNKETIQQMDQGEEEVTAV